VRHHYYTPTDPWPKTLIYDLLSQAGYETAMISASNEKWGGMDQFYETPGLGLYYDAERSGIVRPVDPRDSGFAKEVRRGVLRAGSLVDSHVMDVALSWLAARAQDGRPFFLQISFQSSHFPYNLPESCPRPFQPAEIDFDASFASYPPEKAPVVRNAYFNALHESDRQLGRLVEALTIAGLLKNTLLVVMGENGEAFHENGAVSHAGPPVEPAVHIALVLHAPDLAEPAIEEFPVELIDITPTALGLIGFQSHPNFQGINVLGSQRPRLADRVLFFHTENPLCRSDGLLYQGRWKLIHDRVLDDWRLFDVISDPGETRNLIEQQQGLAQRLQATLLQWRHQQLAYYQYPFYYLAYYPPPPPRTPQAGAAGRR
jgi:arylsulfatase A-like enzyme